MFLYLFSVVFVLSGLGIQLYDCRESSSLCSFHHKGAPPHVTSRQQMLSIVALQKFVR